MRRAGLARGLTQAEAPKSRLAATVSMPSRLDANRAYALGRTLAPLAAEGVLIIGSGSLTHNLSEYRSDGPPEPYAGAFAAWIGRAITDGDRGLLLRH